MPNAIIEYAHDIRDATGAELVAAVHRTLLESEMFSPGAIKTRAYQAVDYDVGTFGDAARFVHLRLDLLAGRGEGERQALSQRLLHTLSEIAPTVEQLTVDIREMNRETFSKRARD